MKLFFLSLFLITNSISQTKVYKGNSTYIGNIQLTLKEAKIYKGNSTYIGDIIYTIDNYATQQEFVAIWHTVNYVY